MKRIFIFTLAILPLITSCSNEDILKDETVNKETFNLSITYAGEKYDVPCMLDANDSLIYLDDEFRTLYEKEISKIPNLVTYLKGENEIEYFASETNLLENLDLSFVDSVVFCSNAEANKTRSIVTNTDLAGKFTLWDDKNFKDRSISADISFIRYFDHPKLKIWHNFNDKTSAIKVWSYIPSNDSVYINNAFVSYVYDYAMNPDSYTHSTKYSTNDLRVVFLGYKDSCYGSSVLCCIPDNGGLVSYSNLGNIGWNDKISSVVLRLAVKDLYIAHH